MPSSFIILVISSLAFLFFIPAPIKACSYAPFAKHLDALLTSHLLTDIIIGTPISIQGENIYPEEEDPLYFPIESAVFSIEHTIRGTLSDSVSLVFHYEPCSTIDGVTFQIQEKPQKTDTDRFFLMLFKDKDGNLSMPSGFPLFFQLPEDFDFSSSPFVEYIARFSPSTPPPIDIQVTGPPSFPLSPNTHFNLSITRTVNAPLTAYFPALPYSHLYGASLRQSAAEEISQEVQIGLNLINDTHHDNLNSRGSLDPLIMNQTQFTISDSGSVEINIEDHYADLAPGPYALDAYFSIPISPSQVYAEWWGPLYRFTIGADARPTLVQQRSWGEVKTDACRCQESPSPTQLH